MNKIAANRLGIIRIVAKDLERIAIVPVQAVFGSKPQKTLAVLYTADDSIIRQPVLYLEMAEIPTLPAGRQCHQLKTAKNPPEFLHALQ